MTLFSIDTREIRKFGIIALIFFGCLSCIGIYLQRTVPTCFFGALALLGLCFITLPRPMSPVYRAWLAVAHVIGRIITTLILTIAYYLVITPTALLKLTFDGRPINTKPDRTAVTYWVTRTEPAQPRERFKKRY